MTKIAATFFLLALVCALPGLTRAQSTPQAAKDPQAITILAQCLQAAGGPANLAAIQDFTGSGTITYYWADNPVTGSVTIRGRGTDEFRLDANLPNGTQSWFVSGGAGSLRDVKGTIRTIPFQNGRNLAFLAFPYLKIISALNDPSVAISFLGSVEFNGQQAYAIRLQNTYPPKADPGGSLGRLMEVELMLDPTTNLLQGQRDTVFPPYNSTRSISHEVRYGDYRPINGVLFPYSITETVGGQRTWALQLDSINFNTGLTDSDFQF